MSVVVLHHSMATCGGGERVCAHLLKLLCDYMKLNVTLATVDPVDWGRVERLIGVKIERKPKIVSLLPVQLRAFGIYYRPLTALSLGKVRKKRLTINVHGDIMPVRTDITYLHFPVLAYLRFKMLRNYLKYYKSLLWRLYFEPYRTLQEKEALSYIRETLVITNSRFSAYFIEKLFNVKPLIVYPPVEVDVYLRQRQSDEREDSVIYIARFTVEKNIHLIPYIARELPQYKFYVVGSVSGRGYEYYLYVKKLIEKLNVKNVILLPNLPQEDKIKLLGRCKVYVHLFPTEHYGIAPVEAMASGLALVVPKISGTYTDVCDFGRYGLAYSRLTPSEIVPLIEDAMSRWRQLVAPIEHVLKFSPEQFYRKMKIIVERMLSASNNFT